MPSKQAVTPTPIAATEVHAILKRHMLADGMPLVFDLEKSRGAWFHDARSGADYLDLFSFFASLPVGYNHPRLADEYYRQRLLEAALCKPTNSDIYSRAMASFVRTFAETCIPPSHRSHLFFIEGGALAVENALKCAFDWKYRKNRAAGGPDTENLEVLHFKKAFHGRTGYTLSLTNTADPRKYQYFPRFDWPRIDVPPMRFPHDAAAAAEVALAEAAVLTAAAAAFDARKDRIAAIIIETIQGEGGDNHFRPEFLRGLRALADERQALLIFDEVQSGLGLTGTWWAWQQLGVEPDLFTFGKKTQVCGFASNRRVEEVERNVFVESSRINSTWGGNLVDMVRAEQFVRIIAEENLLANAADVGALAKSALADVATRTGLISNVRGRGLMIAFDLETSARRDELRAKLRDARVLMLSCGDRSLRFRPVLDFSADDARTAVRKIEEVARS